MIDDHVYQSDYAGIDPAKQICTYYYEIEQKTCGSLRTRHKRFVTSPTEISEIVGGAAEIGRKLADRGIKYSGQMSAILADGAIEGMAKGIPLQPPDHFEWFDHCEVNMIESTFNDDTVCFAAWTSTKGDEADHAARKGLINRLMKDRHGTPFEHMWIQFQVTAPIFVWREHHRHRAGFSYNEESARYRTMRPRFYIPPAYRPMVQVEGTKAMDYVMSPAEKYQYDLAAITIKGTARDAYMHYCNLLDNGIVREVARMCLPVNLMSTCIVTMNARALMNFLSLRVKSEDAAYPSNPQWEINQVALEYERHFERLAPLTYRAFHVNGRVAP